MSALDVTANPIEEIHAESYTTATAAAVIPAPINGAGLCHSRGALSFNDRPLNTVQGGEVAGITFDGTDALAGTASDTDAFTMVTDVGRPYKLVQVASTVTLATIGARLMSDTDGTAMAYAAGAAGAPTFSIGFAASTTTGATGIQTILVELAFSEGNPEGHA